MSNPRALFNSAFCISYTEGFPVNAQARAYGIVFGKEWQGPVYPFQTIVIIQAIEENTQNDKG